MDIQQNVLDVLSEASDNMAGADTKTRVEEAKVYDMAYKLLLANDKQYSEGENNKKRLEFEREKEAERLRFEMEKFQMELAAKRDYDERKLEIDKKAADTERHAAWAKVALSSLELGLTAAMGVLMLKYNMKYGGLMGKDAQNWFKDLRHVKI